MSADDCAVPGEAVSQRCVLVFCWLAGNGWSADCRLREARGGKIGRAVPLRIAISASSGARRARRPRERAVEVACRFRGGDYCSLAGRRPLAFVTRKA